MNIILTGPPRSGTTLTVALLNKLPNCVALHEPMDPSKLVGLERTDEVPRYIEAFFDAQRDLLLTQGCAESKVQANSIPDNTFSAEQNADGLRQSIAQHGLVKTSKNLTADFLLAIKHPNCFTALLDTLVGHFACYAVIRNPLGVIMSWNSIAHPLNNGRAPFAEAFDAALKQALDREADKEKRQLHLLNWYFAQYERYLQPNRIIRYEDIIATGGRALTAITPAAETLQENLSSKNNNPAYRQEQKRRLADALLASDGAYWRFYAREAIEQLAADANT